MWSRSAFVQGMVAVLVLVALFYGGHRYQHSVIFVRGASEDRHGLWLAALKGLGGIPRYMGSSADYSYFLAGDLMCSRFKAPTRKLRLPAIFPLGEGTPYAVDAAMVPSYP